MQQYRQKTVDAENLRKSPEPINPMLIKAYIGIGSNLENPLQQINQAKQALGQSR